jgi:hypothetical protein
MHWPAWELELNVGETVQIGDVRITVVDVEGDEIIFHVEQSEGEVWLPHSDMDRQSVLPR